MLEILLNNSKCDLSTDTVVGLNKQPFDITNVPSTKVDFTNKFTLPRTPTNEKILGFSAIAGSQSGVAYDELSCKIIDGFIIGEGYAILNGASKDNYSLTYFDQKRKFAKLAAEKKLNRLVADHYNDLLPYNLGSTWSAAVINLKAGWNGVILPFQANKITAGTGFDDIFVSDESLLLGYPIKKSNLYLNIKTILTTFATDNGYTYTDNPNIPLYFPLHNITVQYMSGAYRLSLAQSDTTVDSYPNYTVMDLIRIYAQKVNSFVDIDEKNKTISIVPFLSLYTTVDDSLNDKIVSYRKIFTSSAYSQKNIISFKADQGANSGDYDMIFSVNNDNLNLEKKHLQINSAAPKYLYYEDWDLNDYEIESNGESIPLMYIDPSDVSTKFLYVKIIVNPSTVNSYSAALPKLKWYDATAFYTDMEAPVFNKLEVFDAEVYMNSIDYLGITPYKKYFFEKLGGNFIINKVSGFNPSNKGTTKLELIRIR